MWTKISWFPWMGAMKPKPRSSFHFARVPLYRISEGYWDRLRSTVR
jgi:hypothetical protein